MRLDGIAAAAPHLIERLEHFRTFTMAHPRLVAARDELMDAIDGATPGSLILVLGPTGVGKTTLRLKAEGVLGQQMPPSPGRLPLVSLDVPPPHAARFSWRDYFSRLLVAMDEPLIDAKTGRLTTGTPPARSIAIGSDLSYAAEQALRYRRPPVVFVDEAHLARIRSRPRTTNPPFAFPARSVFRAAVI